MSLKLVGTGGVAAVPQRKRPGRERKSLQVHSLRGDLVLRNCQPSPDPEKIDAVADVVPCACARLRLNGFRTEKDFCFRLVAGSFPRVEVMVQTGLGSHVIPIIAVDLLNQAPMGIQGEIFPVIPRIQKKCGADLPEIADTLDSARGLPRTMK